MSKTQECIELITKAGGVLFGSRAWGGYNNYSDYDFFMKIEQYDLVETKMFLHSNDHNISVYYAQGHYFLFYDGHNILNPSKINITICKQDDYDIWQRATTMMKFVPPRVLQVKEYRHLLFENLISVMTPLNNMTPPLSNPFTITPKTKIL